MLIIVGKIQAFELVLRRPSAGEEALGLMETA